MEVLRSPKGRSWPTVLRSPEDDQWPTDLRSPEADQWPTVLRSPEADQWPTVLRSPEADLSPGLGPCHPADELQHKALVCDRVAFVRAAFFCVVDPPLLREGRIAGGIGQNLEEAGPGDDWPLFGEAAGEDQQEEPATEAGGPDT